MTTDAVAKHETLEDLEELKWHTEHIAARLDRLSDAENPASQTIRELLKANLQDLQAACCGNNLGPRVLLVECEDLTRQLYKLIAFLETETEWHSAAASITHPVRDLSPLTVVFGYNDYQRGYIPRAQEFEAHFALGYSTDPGVQSRSLLFSSGMGAIHTLLLFLLKGGRNLLLGKRTYYETQELLLRSFGSAASNIAPLDEESRNVGELERKLLWADVLLLDSLTLDIEAIRTDLGFIFRAIERAGKHGIDIVVDNTVIGPELCLPKPPPHSRLFVVESLIKNYQAGLDLGASGVVTVAQAEPDNGLIPELETIRGISGTNISSYNARLLPLLPRWLVLQRLERQKRNGSILAERLGKAYRVGLVGSAGLVFVEHPFPEDALRMVELLTLARQQRLIKGTSFGFNSTRIAIPPLGSGNLRFACGMESFVSIQELADTLRLALDVTTDRRLAGFCVHPSRFFPDYPGNKIASIQDISALNRYLQELNAAATGAASVRR